MYGFNVARSIVHPPQIFSHPLFAGLLISQREGLFTKSAVASAKFSVGGTYVNLAETWDPVGCADALRPVPNGR
jgi:hypothetical protein